jgi:hypothetical protein
MRWFHHDSHAKADSKLQLLGAKFGPEGMGIYWGVVEELAKLESGFQVKLIDFSPAADEQFQQLLDNPRAAHPFGSKAALEEIPILPPTPLVAALFTTCTRLKEVLDYCASIGLFDRERWTRYGVVFSPGLEERADNYTQRMARVGKRKDRELPVIREERCTNFVRTEYEQSSENVPLDQIQIKIRSDLEKAGQKRPEDINNLSTQPQPAVVEHEENFDEFQQSVSDILQEWNGTHRQRFLWNPTREDLKRLFKGGTHIQRQSLIYASMNFFPDKYSFSQVVLRAISLMLESSEKRRIRDPFAWVWTCLFGSDSSGTPSWVQLVSRSEESRRIARTVGQSWDSAMGNLN